MSKVPHHHCNCPSLWDRELNDVCGGRCICVLGKARDWAVLGPHVSPHRPCHHFQCLNLYIKFSYHLLLHLSLTLQTLLLVWNSCKIWYVGLELEIWPPGHVCLVPAGCSHFNPCWEVCTFEMAHHHWIFSRFLAGSFCGPSGHSMFATSDLETSPSLFAAFHTTWGCLFLYVCLCLTTLFDLDPKHLVLTIVTYILWPAVVFFRIEDALQYLLLPVTPLLTSTVVRAWVVACIQILVGCWS